MSTASLVRYGAPAALKIYRSRKRARAVYAGAKYVYKHRKKVKWAARKIQRAWKGRQRRMVGGAPGTAMSTQGPPVTAMTNVRLRTLYYQNMPDAPTKSNPNDINVRDKTRVMYSGYKICRIFENRGAAPQHIYVVNWAIIQWRRDSYPPLGSDVTDVVRNQFFRDVSDTTDRFSDFNDAPLTGAGIWEPKYTCNPMNPSKPYRIVMRKKFTLHPRIEGSGFQNGTWQNFKKLDFYLKVGKEMTFENNTADLTTTPMAEIWWSDCRSPLDYPASGPGNDQNMRTLSHHHLYFRDATKTCC